MVTAIEVAIGPGGVPGTFRVEVVASPAGEATTIVELDVDALLARRGLLQHAVLASAVPSRRILPETEQPVREVGEVLFAGLLGAAEVAGRYQATAALAALRGEGLRVVLRIDTPRLAGLPCETMYDQAAGAYVCRRDQLVRHVPVASVPAPLRVELPLRILGVVSSPRGLPSLDIGKEQNQLARALAPSASQGLTELRWAPGATWADLQDLLLGEEWHVLHFIGHGDFDPGLDEGVLALTREDGRADLVAAHRLTDLLHQARPMPRLVVLNSCSGGTVGATDLFSGTAAALVRGGISAVAAMQYEISDPAAIAFARGFYTAVVRGRGVDDAVSSGRIAILGLGERTLEWVTPVLYLRGHDSRLFTLPAAAGQTRREDTDANDTGINGLGFPGDMSSPRVTGTAADSNKHSQPDQPGKASRFGFIRRRHRTAPFADLPQPSAAPATPRTDLPQPSAAPATPSPSRLIRTLTGHTEKVNGIAFSPDGTLLATSSSDKTARLWDVATGESVHTFTADDYLRGVAFSPGGTHVATSLEGGGAYLWEVATGRSKRIGGRGNRAAAVAFSPDGTLLATASWDNTARLWEVDSGECLRTFTGHTGEVTGVAFNPDGTLLATSSLDETARLWDVSSGERVRTLTRHTVQVRGVAFSPDGTLLATANSDKTARLWA